MILTRNMFLQVVMNVWNLIIVLLCCIFIIRVDGGAVQMTSANFDTLVSQHEVTLINFYADWCRFSQILSPVFEEAAAKIQSEFPGDDKVLFGKVDCEKEGTVASRFHISKYPTLKMIRNGQVAKREYRGQRSADAIVSFIREQMVDPIKPVEKLIELQQIEDRKMALVGFFANKEAPEYNIFRRTAMNLKDDCEFYAALGEIAKTAEGQVQNKVVFRPARTKFGTKDVTYPGSLLSLEELNVWATANCIPLVREITFENAEELTEEGLPFLILFHHPDDHAIVEQYNQEVKKQLLDDKATINVLTADGVKFAHPLHHLGKTQKDLPLIAIDSFRHMYLFPDIKEMTVGRKLKLFVDDLYSGKLHREFHYGPDPTPQEVAHNPDGVDPATQQEKQQPPTNPPSSTFRKLAPSKNRYTLLDEL